MLRIVAIVLASMLAGCVGQPREEAAAPAPAAPAGDGYAVTPGTPQGDDALYRALGGLPAITAVVDEALAQIGNDLRINLLFADSDMKYVRARLIEQICAGTGGPCTYTGLSMEEAHSGQDIKPEEFGYFVEDLVAAMDKLKVPAKQQQDLLALLGSMQGQVVGQ
ncbi:MAG TPA: group 1 truncated hemoglobin [Xanthomonadales bacterium]|nr:group 1 truncated hemoglobin [Xanthomonadales bacterium]